MFSVRPNKNVFYELFEKLADILMRSAEHMARSLDDFDDPLGSAEQAKELERAADEVVHGTMTRLHKTFITPMDRADIRRLVVYLDDVVDLIHDAMNRLSLYDIREIRPEAQAMAGFLVEAATHIRNAVHGLRNLKEQRRILEQCVAIHECEEKGDGEYHRALAFLFQPGSDPLLSMKWKDVFEDMERALDCSEDVAVAIEGLVMEYA